MGWKERGHYTGHLAFSFIERNTGIMSYKVALPCLCYFLPMLLERGEMFVFLLFFVIEMALENAACNIKN